MVRVDLVGRLLSIAGSIAIAWATYGLLSMGITECGGDGPACPPEATRYFVAIVIGVLVAGLGGVIGRTLLAALVVPGAAVGALAAAATLDSGERGEALILGLVLLLLFLTPAQLIRRARQRAELRARLLAEGRPATGTVTGVVDTGTRINNNPRVNLTLRIEPDDAAAPFEQKQTLTVPQVDPPYRGRRYPVWYDPANPSQLLIITKVDDRTPPALREKFEQLATPPAAADPLDRLAKLNELREAGALTEEEYSAQKARILDG